MMIKLILLIRKTYKNVLDTTLEKDVRETHTPIKPNINIDKNSAEVDIAPAKYTLLCKVSHSQLSLMQRKPNFDIKINEVNGP